MPKPLDMMPAEEFMEANAKLNVAAISSRRLTNLGAALRLSAILFVFIVHAF